MPRFIYKADIRMTLDCSLNPFKQSVVFRRPRELGDRYPVRKVNGDGTTTVSTSASALKKKKTGKSAVRGTTKVHNRTVVRPCAETADPSQETPYQDGSSQNNTAQEGQLPSRPKVENDGKRG